MRKKKKLEDVVVDDTDMTEEEFMATQPEPASAAIGGPSSFPDENLSNILNLFNTTAERVPGSDLVKVVEETVPHVVMTPQGRAWALREAQSRVTSMEISRDQKFPLDEFYDNVTELAAWLCGEETYVDGFVAGATS